MYVDFRTTLKFFAVNDRFLRNKKLRVHVLTMKYVKSRNFHFNLKKLIININRLLPSNFSSCCTFHIEYICQICTLKRYVVRTWAYLVWCSLPGTLSKASSRKTSSDANLMRNFWSQKSSESRWRNSKTVADY